MARLLHPLTVATPQPAAASPVRHLVLAAEHLQRLQPTTWICIRSGAPVSTSACRSTRRPIKALQQIVQQGKARYLGFSKWTPMQIRAAIEIAGPDLFVSSQPQPKIEGEPGRQRSSPAALPTPTPQRCPTQTSSTQIRRPPAPSARSGHLDHRPAARARIEWDRLWSVALGGSVDPARASRERSARFVRQGCRRADDQAIR